MAKAKENLKSKRDELMIAGLPLDKVYGITNLGYYLDKNGMPFKNVNGQLIPDGDYSPRKHGHMVPKGLVRARDIIKINGKKETGRQSLARTG